jgi:hypothetical protein
MSHARLFALATSLYAVSSLFGCSSDESDDDDGSTAGTSGSTGKGGASGSGAGTTGKGGSSGSTGKGGSSGSSGATGGSAGTNASGAAGTDGGADSGGTSGSAGSDAGEAGTSGSAGAGEAGENGVGGAGGEGGGTAGEGEMNFFVTSDTSATANLGGLVGADARCQALAEAVGHGDQIWVAYLSTEDPTVNARDRIGEGPYYNALGALIAADKDALHARVGDAALFLDENGERINGQWEGSPDPNEHDILTGTEPDGTVAAGLTCGDWTATTGESRVGHSDGLGPNMNPAEPYSFWNGSHEGQCGDTAPGGGSGRIYCFVAP